MANVKLTKALREDYETLFNTCNVRPDKASEVNSLVGKIVANQARYAAVQSAVGVPWFFVGTVHCMEASLSFTSHLHNGDPLTARTVQVPAGRPKNGQPPFTWEESAIDALTFEGLGNWTDWSVAGMLYKLEAYNGFGYRTLSSPIPSPYLWSFSDHYTRGKFVGDHDFSATAVSKQCGGAVLLRRMAERGDFQFDSTGVPVIEDGEQPEGDTESMIQYWTKGPEIPGARALQEFLNSMPGVFVKVDGKPGENTSGAVKKVLGSYLAGDPRAEE